MRKHMMHLTLLWVATLTLGTYGSVLAVDRSGERVKERIVVTEPSVAGGTNARLDDKKSIAVAQPGWLTTGRLKIDYADRNKDSFTGIRGPWLKQHNVRATRDLRNPLLDQTCGGIMLNTYSYPDGWGSKEQLKVVRGWGVREAFSDRQFTTNRLGVRNAKGPWPFGRLWPWTAFEGNLVLREARLGRIDKERRHIDPSQASLRSRVIGGVRMFTKNPLAARERPTKETDSRIDLHPLQARA